MRNFKLALRTAPVLCIVMLSACGGNSDPDDIYADIKTGCIEHFKEEVPQFAKAVIAFDAWEKNGKVIIEFGFETETGKGKLKTTNRTVVYQCYYDPNTEIFRLPSKFESVISRDGTPVKSLDVIPKPQ